MTAYERFTLIKSIAIRRIPHCPLHGPKERDKNGHSFCRLCKRAKDREWRKDHPPTPRTKSVKHRWQIANAEAIKKRKRAWFVANRAACAARKRKYRQRQKLLATKQKKIEIILEKTSKHIYG
jgi:hypothetical protein